MNMNTLFPPNDKDAVGQWSAKYVDRESDIPRSRFRLLERWYQWTAPPIPPATAGLEQRESARRGRLTSTILLLIIGIVFGLALPVAIAQQLLILLLILSVIMIVLITALFLNRTGRSSIAAWLLVAIIDLGLCLSILTTPGPAGLNANSVPLYDIMVQSELIAVSLLPARSVFIIAFFNSGFIALSLTYAKHAPSLQALLASAGPEVYARPIALHIIVAVVTYLWVRSATNAIARADRAEVIAALEHELAQQEHAIALQKRQLDYSINQIIDTLMRISNGDFNARVPLTQDNVLWQVAGSLNNLLSRLQRLRHIESEMQKMQKRVQQTIHLEHEILRIRNEARRLAEALGNAKTSKRAIHSTSTGTLLDPVLAELNGSFLFQSTNSENSQQKILTSPLDPFNTLSKPLEFSPKLSEFSPKLSEFSPKPSMEFSPAPALERDRSDPMRQLRNSRLFRKEPS